MKIKIKKMRNYVVAILAFALRMSLFYLGFDTHIKWIPELSTSVSDWNRLKESLYLEELGVGLYSGNSIKQPPLLIFPFKALLGIFGDKGGITSAVIFSILDVSIAFALFEIGKRFQTSESEYFGEIVIENNYKEMSEEEKEKELKKFNLPLLLFLFYLFNPWTVICGLFSFFCTLFSSNSKLSLFCKKRLFGQISFYSEHLLCSAKSQVRFEGK